MKILLLIVLFLKLSIIANSQNCNLQKWSEATNPKTIGKMVVERFLKESYYNPWHPKPINRISYLEVCTWYGALQFTRTIKDEKILKHLENRFILLYTEKRDLLPAPDHVDNNIFGIIPLELYILTKNKTYKEIGLYYADTQWNMPKEFDTNERDKFLNLLDQDLTWQTRYWIDDMYMITMLQTQAYRVTNERKYIDRAAHQMRVYLDTLQLSNGLFHHASDAPFFWGRGNGWIAVGMVELLSSLPDDNENKEYIMNSYLRMMDTLKHFQRDSGLWGQLIDDPESWDETSCSGMFAYAFIMGTKYGWLDKKEYCPAIKKAWGELVNRINKDGEISDVCIGTNRKNDYQYYLDRERVTGDLHGQAPLLWCTSVLMSLRY